ncbi:MAG: TonB-dependent receptor [Candidatus Solibacter usitatus]|nr:TonB-dependent receptor [Candidatus Solibacter usitatus]
MRFAVLSLCTVSLFAQEFRATIQGTVYDASKASVAGADVLLRNADTSVERKTETDASGHYAFPLLPPGNYTVTTKKPGFKTDVREGVRASLGDILRLDIDLAIGQATETISVSAAAAAVQTDSSSLGSVVRKEMIESLPLKGHSSLFMFTLATGVVNNRYGEDTRANDTITNVSYSANGSPMASGDVSVDGVANTVNVNRGVNISQWVPAVDAVGEFKLQAGTLPAEYGRSGGSFMNIVIKSGTNDLHGTFYEFLRNAALDANSFYNNRAGLRLARYGSNTYGFTIGGPVVFPKLYNGKNRTFFFYSFEGSREGNGLTNLLNTPTEKMRGGDFSEFTGAIYNPFSGRMVNGVPVRDPVPGNIVPATLQDAAGRGIMANYPRPNIAGPNRLTPWVQNFTYSYKWPRDYDTHVIKIDQSFGTKNQMFARVNFGEGRLVFPRSFDGAASGGGGNRVKRPHKGIAFSDTHLLSAHTTIDVRLGYARGIEDNKPWSDGFDPTTLGFVPSYKNLTQGLAFPTVNVTDFQGLGGSPLIKDPGDTWSLQPSASSQRGSHLIKIGGETRLLRGNFFRNLNPAGTYSFGPNQTGGPNVNTPAGGFALASLLFGYGSGSLSSNTGVSIQNVYYGLYVQDDWKVTKRLTLNIGLRWEYESPRTERYDRTTRGFGFGVANPLRVPGLGLTGGLLYAGKDGRPRGIYEPDRNNFAPRIGFAYSLTSKNVLRGGYALSYIPVIGSVFSDGYSNDTPWIASLDGGLTITNKLSNPFPTGLIPAIGNAQGLLTLVGQGVSFVEPGDKTPKFHNWHFDIQRELPSHSLLEIAYVGSRGVSLVAPTENLNQVPVSAFAQGAALKQQVENPFFGILTSGGLTGRTVAREQLLRPYPQYTGVSRANPAFGNSSYHSLQMKLEKRLAQGLTALISFTASKNLSDLNNPRNAFDRGVERAVSDIDVPQRLTIAGSWDVPVGRGRTYGRTMHRAADLAVGGWQLSTFQTYQGGFALGYGFSGGTFAAGTSPRVQAIGDPNAGISGSHQARLDRYFNTDAFARPADFALGNLAARLHTVRSPGMNNNNITATKDFQMVERFKAQFRASFFNALNHPVFSGPNTTVGNASFGRISSQANLSRQVEFGLRISY